MSCLQRRRRDVLRRPHFPRFCWQPQRRWGREDSNLWRQCIGIWSGLVENHAPMHHARGGF